MKTFHVQLGRGLKVDVLKLVETRVGICANSGAGKSYLMRLLIEQISGRIPVHILDWEGEYSTVRDEIDAVYVAKGGDLAPQPSTAHKLALKLLEKRVSVVLDVSSLPRVDRLNFVGAYLEGLLDAPAASWTPILVFIDEAHRVCLDEETEVLTKRGWRKYTQIEKGMPVVAFDLETEEYRYEEVQDVLIHEHDGPMVSIETRGVSMLATPDHRVVVQRTQRAQGRYAKTYAWTFCPAGDLPQQFHIPLGGSPCGPGVEGLSTDMLRVIGWLLTDGYPSGGNFGIGLSQAAGTTKYGKKMVDEMRTLLSALFHDVSEGRRKSRTGGVIHGREVQSRQEEVWFYIGVRSRRQIEQILKEPFVIKKKRRVPRHILENCSREQLAALFQGLLEGDGGGTKFTPGKSTALADDFQEIALKLGVCAKGRLRPGVDTWTLDMSQRKRHYVREASKAIYVGKVWDITVPSGAFVVRRHGRSYVTGNCPEVASKGGGKNLISAIHRARASVIALMDSGRKRAMGGVLASQRIAKVAKDALGEGNNKFFGRFVQDTDLKRVGEDLGLDRRLRDGVKQFKPGEFFAQGPALQDPGKTHRFRASMPKTKPPKFGDKGSPSRPSKTMKKVLEELATIPDEVAREIRDFKDAKAEITRLNRELKTAQRGTKKALLPSKELLQEAELRGEQRGASKQVKLYKTTQKQIDGWLRRFGTTLLQVQRGVKDIDNIRASLGTLNDFEIPLLEPKVYPEAPKKFETLRETGQREGKKASKRVVDKAIEHATNGKLPFSWKSAPGKVFTVLLQYHPEELTHKRAASLAGINAKSSTMRGAMAKLRALGFVDGMTVTSDGLAHQHDVEPLPEGDELIEGWKAKLGGATRRVFDVLIEEDGSGDRDTIAGIAEIDPESSTWRGALAKLRKLGLLERGGDELRFTEHVMEALG